MWLPDVMTSMPGLEHGLGRGRGQAHAAGHVLAVGGDEGDVALVPELRQERLDGQPAGPADEVADHQDAAGAPACGREGRAGGRGHGGYLAYSTARVSRMTVTLIWPG